MGKKVNPPGNGDSGGIYTPVDGALAVHPRPALLLINDVYFRYSRKAPWVLSGASLIVRSGERIGIIGDNGVGKSTIAKLIVGFFPADKGKVALFDKPVSWRTHFPDLAYIGDPSPFTVSKHPPATGR